MFKHETKRLAGVGTFVSCLLVMVLYVCGFCLMVHDFVQDQPVKAGPEQEAISAARVACEPPSEC